MTINPPHSLMCLQGLKREIDRTFVKISELRSEQLELRTTLAARDTILVDTRAQLEFVGKLVSVGFVGNLVVRMEIEDSEVEEFSKEYGLPMEHIKILGPRKSC